MKSVLWRIVKRLSYTEDARCLKVNMSGSTFSVWNIQVLAGTKLCQRHPIQLAGQSLPVYSNQPATSAL